MFIMVTLALLVNTAWGNITPSTQVLVAEDKTQLAYGSGYVVLNLGNYENSEALVCIVATLKKNGKWDLIEGLLLLIYMPSRELLTGIISIQGRYAGRFDYTDMNGKYKFIPIILQDY